MQSGKINLKYVNIVAKERLSWSGIFFYFVTGDSPFSVKYTSFLVGWIYFLAILRPLEASGIVG